VFELQSGRLLRERPLHALQVLARVPAEARPDLGDRGAPRPDGAPFRHEIGHYYWDVLVRDTAENERFRALFGDEKRDYAAELKRHYDAGPPPDWQSAYVSAYATMHPWEDWAETWAHYLHIVDTLETARSYGMALRPQPVGLPKPPRDLSVTAQRLDFDDFEDLLGAWFPLTFALNSLNRGMGLPDLYPFVLSEPAIKKLRFVQDVIERAREGSG
jgi:hypothetical protein